MTPAEHLIIVVRRVQADRRVHCCAIAPDGKAAMIHVKGSPTARFRGTVEQVAVHLCDALGVDA